MASLSAAACVRPAAQADLHPIPRQNVLLVTIDTLRADALGSYGGPAATPALDRLAAEGVRFDFAHAHAVVTLTSHASILTGRYPYQHGLRDNAGYRLPRDARTIATLLKRAGYATAAFVGAFPLHARFGLDAGFDVYDDRFGETGAPDEFAMPERPASAVVPLAREWISGAGKAGGAGGAGERPWFVWVHVFDPHAPYRPPSPFREQYAQRPYYGEVAAVDAALASLFDDLRASKGPTLVIVTGDHGEALGDHGEETHGLFAYESTLRVPLLIAELGAQHRSELSHVPARHVDLLPTVLEATGQPVPSDLPGRSLLPASERVGDGAARSSYFEAMSGVLNRGWAPLSGVLAGREKYIDLPIVERYDLAADPQERTNRAGADPARDRTLASLLRGFGAALPGERSAEDPDALSRLRALGYVSGSAAPKARYTEADDPKRLVDLDQIIHRGVEAFSAGRAADAAALYQSVIERRPDMAIAYRYLAFVLAARGQLLDAIAVLQRGVHAGVADPRAMAQLGGYLADAGRLREAIALLEPLTRAVDRPSGGDVADVEALNTLGIAYAQAGRIDDAQRTFERVRAANPTSSVPLENLGMLALERADLAAAGTHYRAAAALNPRSSRAHAGLGVVALRSGDRTAAVDEWTRAVQLDPANFDALFNLATTIARSGDMNRARPYLEQFVKTAPPSYANERQEISRLLSAASRQR